MDIVIDTNTVNADPLLKGPAIIKLASAAKEGEHTILLPQIVQKELEKHFNSSIDNIYKEVQKNIESFSEIAGTIITNPITEDHAEKTKNKYNRDLRKRMKELGIKTLNATLNAERMMNKSVFRKKPFKANAAGTPDVLIWESILALAEKYRGMPETTSTRIIYVTGNSNDFCENGSVDKLHPDLLEDLDELGIPSQVIKVVPKLDDAFKLIHETGGNDIAANDLIRYIKSDSFLEHELYHDLTNKIMSALPRLSFDPGDAGMPDIYEDPSVDMIHEDYVFEVENVESIGDNKFSIEWHVSVTCTFDIYVPKWEIGENDEISIYDYEWNDHYAAAQIEKNVWFMVNIITDEKLKEIEGFEVNIDEERNNPQEKEFINL